MIWHGMAWLLLLTSGEWSSGKLAAATFQKWSRSMPSPSAWPGHSDIVSRG